MDNIIVESFTKDPVKYLSDECKKRGISLSELCDTAKVDRSTIERWKGGIPKTVDIIERLQIALKNIPVAV